MGELRARHLVGLWRRLLCICASSANTFFGVGDRDGRDIVVQVANRICFQGRALEEPPLAVDNELIHVLVARFGTVENGAVFRPVI